MLAFFAIARLIWKQDTKLDDEDEGDDEVAAEVGEAAKRIEREKVEESGQRCNGSKIRTREGDLDC